MHPLPSVKKWWKNGKGCLPSKVPSLREKGEVGRKGCVPSRVGQGREIRGVSLHRANDVDSCLHPSFFADVILVAVIVITDALWDKTRSFSDINNSLSHERGSERSERCERTSERTSEWPSTYVSIHGCFEPE